MQVDPEAQVVGPVYPVPPHCPHLATVPVGVDELVGVDPPTEEDEPPLPPVVRVPV